MKRHLITALVVFLLGVPAMAYADSDETLGCDVLEIKASREGDKVDPELKVLEKQFSKPPLSSWKSFTLLKKHNESVSKMKAAAVKLVPGTQMSLVYLGLNKEAGKKDRLRLEFTLDDSSGKRKAKATIAVDVGDHYAVVGDPMEGGAQYILAVACVVR